MFKVGRQGTFKCDIIYKSERVQIVRTKYQPDDDQAYFKLEVKDERYFKPFIYDFTEAQAVRIQQKWEQNEDKALTIEVLNSLGAQDIGGGLMVTVKSGNEELDKEITEDIKEKLNKKPNQ
jgi:hypothetical protein